MSTRSVQGRWGECHYFGKDEYVGKSIHNYGEYNPDETEKIIELASLRSGICLDIGANIGVMAQALSAVGKVVVAFEPQPAVYRLLCKNHTGQNENVALGSVEGEGVMPRVDYNSRGNYGGMGLGFKSDLGVIMVPIKTLDSYNFAEVGFIKMDVEGYELEALKGAVGLIDRCRPIMYIEDDRMEKSKALRDFIRSLGYTIEEHKPTLYRENNFFGKRVNVWNKNFASHNIICRPQ